MFSSPVKRNPDDVMGLPQLSPLTPSPHLPILRTPTKIVSSDSYILSSETSDSFVLSSAIKKEVDKFCEEIDQADIALYDEITIDDSKLSLESIKRDVTYENSTGNISAAPNEHSSAAPVENSCAINHPVPSNGKIVVSVSSLEHTYKEPDSKDIKKFHCAICDHLVGSKKRLIAHMGLHTEYVPYVCAVCNKGFLSKAHYTRHIRKPHSKGPFKCDQCGKVFPEKQYLSKHIARVHQKVYKYQCAECGYNAISFFYLKKHAAVHLPFKPYKCNQCPFETHKKLNLAVHQAVHSEIRSYACIQCGKTYKTNNAYCAHLRTHGESSSKCKFCSSYFSSPRNLKHHTLQLHNREETIFCGKCREDYVDKHALVTHRKRKNVEKETLACDRKLCTFQGMNECQLKAHMLTHNAYKTQGCPICKLKYSNILDLKKHLWSHSNIIRCLDCGGSFDNKQDIIIQLTVQCPPATEIMDNTNCVPADTKSMNNASDISTGNTRKNSVGGTPVKEEPYVILEVLQMETENGGNCVQYNLLRANDNEDEIAKSDQTNNYQEDNKATSEVNNHLKVKCCNKIHDKMDVLKRFEKYVQNKEQ